MKGSRDGGERRWTEGQQLIWTVTNGSYRAGGWLPREMYLVALRSNGRTAGTSAPFRILRPGFSSLSTWAVRERAFPIPLRALFITVQRSKIASPDVNGGVV